MCVQLNLLLLKAMHVHFAENRQKSTRKHPAKRNSWLRTTAADDVNRERRRRRQEHRKGGGGSAAVAARRHDVIKKWWPNIDLHGYLMRRFRVHRH